LVGLGNLLTWYWYIILYFNRAKTKKTKGAIMRKLVIILTITLTTLFVTGCANNGLAVGSSQVKYVFEEGKVLTTQKVLVAKSKQAALTGAVAGGVVGGVVDKSAKGAIGGAVAGGLMGAVAGLFAETEAFETVIENENKEKVTAYIEVELRKNTRVEYVYRDGEITNVSVLPPKKTAKKTVKKEVKKREIVKQTKPLEVPVATTQTTTPMVTKKEIQQVAVETATTEKTDSFWE
jgi:outer membrane lipoprotein SlyB